MVPSFLAPAVAAPAVIGVVLVIAGRRPRLRRIGALMATIGLLALCGVSLMVDRAADCAARGGTLVEGRPIRVEGRHGSEYLDVDRCALPPR